MEHFQWMESSPNKQALAEELADVALYLFQLSSLVGIDLEEAIMNKLGRNFDRSWG